MNEVMKKYSTLKFGDAIHGSVSLSWGVFTIYSDGPDFDSLSELKRMSLN